MSAPTLLAPVFFAISMCLVMTWLCIGLENYLVNERARSILSWISPVFLVAIPVSLTFYLFGTNPS
jgi:hypothetical protein